MFLIPVFLVVLIIMRRAMHHDRVAPNRGGLNAIFASIWTNTKEDEVLAALRGDPSASWCRAADRSVVLSHQGLSDAAGDVVGAAAPPPWLTTSSLLGLIRAGVQHVEVDIFLPNLEVADGVASGAECLLVGHPRKMAEALDLPGSRTGIHADCATIKAKAQRKLWPAPLTLTQLFAWLSFNQEAQSAVLPGKFQRVLVEPKATPFVASKLSLVLQAAIESCRASNPSNFGPEVVLMLQSMADLRLANKLIRAQPSGMPLSGRLQLGLVAKDQQPDGTSVAGDPAAATAAMMQLSTNLPEATALGCGMLLPSTRLLLSAPKQGAILVRQAQVNAASPESV
jgi:hypothetical protein